MRIQAQELGWPVQVIALPELVVPDDSRFLLMLHLRCRQLVEITGAHFV
ncbi:hypothetical protein [Lactobacillus delbrueckii]|nr:hypothetical protein [Lactobacillus delbrueckii]